MKSKSGLNSNARRMDMSSSSPNYYNSLLHVVTTSSVKSKGSVCDKLFENMRFVVSGLESDLKLVLIYTFKNTISDLFFLIFVSIIDLSC